MSNLRLLYYDELVAIMSWEVYGNSVKVTTRMVLQEAYALPGSFILALDVFIVLESTKALLVFGND